MACRELPHRAISQNYSVRGDWPSHLIDELLHLCIKSTLRQNFLFPLNECNFREVCVYVFNINQLIDKHLNHDFLILIHILHLIPDPLNLGTALPV